jgi:predicted Na+-dependent transporter
MNATLEIALLALVPVCMLFVGSAVIFARAKTVISFVQILGAGCIVIVVLNHLSEALHLFPWMNWGHPHSIGHYLDFWSAVLGGSLFPVGYLFHSLKKRCFRGKG